jgi:nucleotide-binding universal stress UspA family protein
MNKILVPTDLSEQSENAAKLAADIARWTGASIYLLHVMEPPSPSSSASSTGYGGALEGSALKKTARQRFDRFKKRSFFQGLRVITSIQYDRPHDNIVREAEERKVDLIVMGSYGASGFKELFIGSNAERAIRMASCPVLTVKDEVKGNAVNRILFASHFGDEVYPVFGTIRELAELFGAELHLLEVNSSNSIERNDEIRERIEAFAARFRLQDYKVRVENADSIEDGILQASEDLDTDLIALTTHGRRGLAHWLSGSIAEDVANHSSRSVLSIRLSKG